MIGIKTNIITKPNPNLFGGGIEKYTEENPYVLRGKDRDYYKVLYPQHPASLKNGHTYTLQLKSDGILSNSSVGHYNTHKDFVIYMKDDHTEYYERFNLNNQTMALGNGALIAGMGKEVADIFCDKDFCVADVIFTAVGGVLGGILFML